MPQVTTPIRAVALISGGGSNLQAIIDAVAHHELAIELDCVISNRADAYGLVRAQQAGITTKTLDHKAFSNREAFDEALMTLIDGFNPQLVILAGFMRILTAPLVKHYRGRMLNIHPSLLPKHTGLNTHQRAIDAKDAFHGATVHFVTEELDGGPLIIQGKVAVLSDDNVDTLAERVLSIEHIIYPQAISWFAQQRLILSGDRCIFDGQALNTPRIIEAL